MTGRSDRTTPQRRAARILGLCLVASLALAGCGDKGTNEIKNLKEQVQRAYGNKDFTKVLSLSQKGLGLAREKMGDTAPDTLYFVQAVAEGYLSLHNTRGAITGLKQELAMRAAAKQPEKKLQPRRTLLIKLAEESGDVMTAGEQAVLVSKGINMGTGKDPQPVYQLLPTYPAAQYQQKVEGDVDIVFSLDSTGDVTDATVAKSTPAQVFDQAALESFRKWRFTPMLDATGRPIPGSNFKFTLAFRMGK